MSELTEVKPIEIIILATRTWADHVLQVVVEGHGTGGPLPKSRPHGEVLILRTQYNTIQVGGLKPLAALACKPSGSWEIKHIASTL
jgi:hypothetical protein